MINKSQSGFRSLSRHFCILIILIASFYFPFTAICQTILQPIEISSSWNPVGSGARALGMGGAFIAVADDATAASWNPGGLIQLERPEISVVGDMLTRKNSNSFGGHPEGSNSSRITGEDLNYFSLSYPFQLFNRNMIVSLNYQNLYDFHLGSDFRLSLEETITTPAVMTTWDLDKQVNLFHEGNLYAAGLAYSIRLNPELAVGVTLNFWENWLGKNRWKEVYRENAAGTVETDLGPPIGSSIDSLAYLSTRVDEYSFDGFNMNFGVLWNPSDKITLAAVLKTPFTADLDYTLNINTTIDIGGAVTANSGNHHESQKLEMPMSYGFGMAYRYSDEFTVSADLYRTEWQDFILKSANGSKTSPVTGLSKAESGIDPTTQMRMGAEYLFINPNFIIPLRGGIFYDPAPAKGSADEYYGFSIGSGVAWGSLIFDAGYQYRWGNNVGSSASQDLDLSKDVTEHKLYSSLIIHF